MKVGILGAGNIAGQMAETIARMENVTVEAVGSRSLKKAEEFAGKYSIKKAYGSYMELVQDPEIDLVYIATVHSSHYDNARICLENGKNVLCEKAFMMNAREAEEIIRLAEEKKLLLAEAIWTRYMPARFMIKEIIDSGEIGKVTSLTANLGYVINHKERLQDPKLGGGALLDVGVYPINFALMVFGDDYDSFSSDVIFGETGVDLMESVTLKWKNGCFAVLHSSMLAATDRLGCVYGDKGYLLVHNINNCEKITIYDINHKVVKEVPVPEKISGYEYQVEACRKAIESGKKECEEMPLKTSLKVMKLLDDIRESWKK